MLAYMTTGARGAPPTWLPRPCLCCAAWCEGLAVDTEPPLLEPAELMEHMELFLEPREEGEEGGVWKMTPPSLVLMSLSTWSGEDGEL